MKELEKNIGYSFKDKSILKTALTHKSILNETENAVCNERLEFLGDSVLGFVVADYLYKNYPEKNEGIMTRARAYVVCEKGLDVIAKEWEISDDIILSYGEEKMGGRHRASILSDAVESIIAAIYIDGGFDEAKRVILKFFADKIDRFISGLSNTANFDYKTNLQELCQSRGLKPIYRLVGERGPAHAKIYTCEVEVNGTVYKAEEDTSKKKAEQKAAANAFKILSKEVNKDDTL